MPFCAQRIRSYPTMHPVTRNAGLCGDLAWLSNTVLSARDLNVFPISCFCCWHQNVSNLSFRACVCPAEKTHFKKMHVHLKAYMRHLQNVQRCYGPCQIKATCLQKHLQAGLSWLKKKCLHAASWACADQQMPQVLDPVKRKWLLNQHAMKTFTHNRARLCNIRPDFCSWPYPWPYQFDGSDISILTRYNS